MATSNKGVKTDSQPSNFVVIENQPDKNGELGTTDIELDVS